MLLKRKKWVGFYYGSHTKDLLTLGFWKDEYIADDEEQENICIYTYTER